MFKANVGSCTSTNAFEAGKTAGMKAAEGLSNPKVAFMYSSVAYDQDELIKGVKEAMNGVPVIGNTSFTGVITPEGFITGDAFVGIMAMEDDMTVGVAGMPKGIDAITTGEEVAKKALENAGRTDSPDYFYMVAPPGEEEFYLKGITKVVGRVPFFGGSAADNTISGEWKLFTDKGSFADGVAVAFFYTDKKFANKFTGAYNETNKSGVITKVVGNRVLAEIDGVPALEKYAEWSGKNTKDLLGMNLLGATICAPLGVKDRLGDLVAIRHPMNGNEDNTMNLGNNIAVNTAIIYMEGSVDELISSTGKTLNELKEKLGANPGAYHLVHCGGRRAGIDSRIDEVVKEIKDAAGDVPFIAEFTFGEYGYEQDGINTCGGLMLSFTGFSK
ncbi:MAG: FIST N-terminal domain-containing protein [Sedimentibacter saalensis]|uniref:FIST signal transduction protein n=1 Tax=Sedimentibacter saalensis TaxID=130788 RepID=UPI002B1ED893|nr:FIST N-terminal domain-containing protein [Sedimentibacter saalensis]MEA5095543.1 FIST N-terminal domain-containing protein [Sedimentibacter saalensis]